ncbi:NADPH-dependent glutamate synthase beta subunit-like oxidoreductase [Thermosporothrix hazakensis]|jgi:NADPH-dependent glutamate synthase beta subunit-like oxidoreductase|uniref:NADPH-dependent glutamate synthase beta subunit-like oxidoreductase n=1 Tax=Thermosporothrix hazakensis TaxID=644383 RepID=A0A326U420_THEHA|nr:FAD-dependent oxidoreductase [Thermosporothrix hazakensis]PZW26415.1 NADPH-dependent glutamate synthase beta subunit-like oxidoreductase [Thermosporothrix hazakensis]GCE48634.1 glutamate synthase [Thermosporothrix hazakensis]
MIDPDSELEPRYQSVITTPDWYQTNIPCQVGCPAHTDVATYIGLISQARFDEAYLLNRRANVVPGVLGRTCARPCEPVCRRNKVDGKPIAICWLKRAAADHREYRHHADPPPITKDKKVAIVGAGSAGLACARDLREMGYPVTIYEQYPVAGGVMINGIPVWRLPREITREECDEYMEDLGVEVKYNTRVGRDVQLTDLLKEYDAVFIGAGCYIPNPMTGPDGKVVKGADLFGVEDGIKLLDKTNFGEPAFIGKRVAIIGAGFTAMDCCRTAIRFGAEKVYVMYRRSEEEQPADEYEVDEAKLEGVEFQYLVSQTEVTSKDGVHVSGIRFIRNKLGDPDASGRRRPVPIPGTEFEIEVDTVVPCFGQYSDTSWLQAEELGLEVNKWGVPLIDYETWMTSYPGLFAGGDYTQGARNLISAIGDGRDAAGAINRYLGGEDIPAEPPVEIELPDYRRGMVDNYESIPHQLIPSLPLKDRYSHTRETEIGYSPEEAVVQARRCLQCQLNIMIDPSICILCSGCVDICPYDCISMEGLSRVVKGDPMHQGTETWRGGADMIIDEEKCIRCGLCVVRCPTDAISMIQFEVSSPNKRWSVSKIPVLNV